MPEDTLDRLLDRKNVTSHLKSRKKELHDMFLMLIQAYKTIHGNVEIDSDVINHLIWELIKIDPVITSFLFDNDTHVNDLKVRLEDGIASRRIVKKVGEILAEYKDEFSF